MIQSMSRSQSLFCCSFVLTFDFPIHSFILQPAFPHKGHNSFCSFFGVSKSLCFSLFVFFNWTLSKVRWPIGMQSMQPSPHVDGPAHENPIQGMAARNQSDKIALRNCLQITFRLSMGVCLCTTPVFCFFWFFLSGPNSDRKSALGIVRAVPALVATGSAALKPRGKTPRDHFGAQRRTATAAGISRSRRAQPTDGSAMEEAAAGPRGRSSRGAERASAHTLHGLHVRR